MSDQSHIIVSTVGNTPVYFRATRSEMQGDDPWSPFIVDARLYDISTREGLDMYEMQVRILRMTTLEPVKTETFECAVQQIKSRYEDLKCYVDELTEI